MLSSVVTVPAAGPSATTSTRARRAELRAAQLLRLTKADSLSPDNELWAGREGGANALWAECNATLEDQTLSVFGHASVYVSHVWKPPENWSAHFPHHEYAEMKRRQLEVGCRLEARHQLNQSALYKEVNLWIDKAAVPPPIMQSDHPRDRTSFNDENEKGGVREGYRMTVKELNKFIREGGQLGAGVGEDDPIYTLVDVNEPRVFSEPMKIRRIDMYGKPSLKPEFQDEEWTMQGTDEVEGGMKEWKKGIPPGRYFIKKVSVADGMEKRSSQKEPKWFQHGVDPHKLDAPYMVESSSTTVRQWLQGLSILSEQLWLEVTLGSVRAESLSLMDEILWKHPRMTVILSWDHFARLWPLYEWATFLLEHSPVSVELSCSLTAPLSTIPLHLDRVRRLSIDAATPLIADPRDAEMLLDRFRTHFRCDWQDHVKYQCSSTPRSTFNREVNWDTDWSRLERFIRCTAIMIFARTMLRDHAYQSREAAAHWYVPWVHLAREVGFPALADRLKEVKPVAWYEACVEDVRKARTRVATDEGRELTEEDAAVTAEALARYTERLDAWFEDTCVPIYRDERREVVRPPKTTAANRGYAHQSRSRGSTFG